jgi:hypothetical protein
MGGIHYGFAAANYETATTDEEMYSSSKQLVFSFLPAILSFAASSFLLYPTPLLLQNVLIGFTGLMLTQLMTLQVDLKYVEKELAPKWFSRFRQRGFFLYMTLTSIIFIVYYS